MTVPIAELPSAGLAPARTFVNASILFTVAAVALQICYPLVHESTRDRLTAAVVVTFAMAAALHAAGCIGVARGLTVVAISVGIGFVAEVVGVRSGIPFGSYRYADSLGPRLAGVPIIVGLAWAMMAWPAAVVARRLAPDAGSARWSSAPGPSRHGTSSSIHRWSPRATGPGGNPLRIFRVCRPYR
mgnify:CR=1 FL=1